MIANEIKKINQQLPVETRLVAVSKYHSVSDILQAYEEGQRIFGESQVQELREKYNTLPKDIEWHFIGHLQTNKVKYIAPYISLIHAVDTPKLLAEISRQGIKCGRCIPCLLELHVAQEDSKYGFSIKACEDYLQSDAWRTLQGIQIRGLMCMASNTDNKQQIATEFERAHAFFKHCREQYFSDKNSFQECSWGMSGDYQIAIKHGSTLVRIGSKIFGDRTY